ncbi:hypothetical protein ILUMI_01785 [Ignelater luminosus]|uniref:YqaJ viral recombinase domain-containing protein n=1 Tax=Ignelater luminosus TaxID=2038154 RepID=A0A8K0GH37_IGNLU|nr:hypothetical protein ILUMI_01785 [Ignelater luminosus]
MDADKATEGFCLSEAMHGVRYQKFITDSDSSVAFTSNELNVDYGPNVEESELDDHILEGEVARLINNLRIDETGFLGASPDGLITEKNALLEVKALFSASHLTANTITEVTEELTKKKKYTYLQFKNGSVLRKTTSIIIR